MSILKAMEVLGSGMAAQRMRMYLVSSNMANAQTTRTADGGPYRRQIPVFEAQNMAGGEAVNRTSFESALEKVAVSEIEKSDAPLPQVYDPSHPDADPETGMVLMPNVNVVEEMVDMMTSTRSFEANVTAFEALKQMVNKAMEIGR